LEDDLADKHGTPVLPTDTLACPLCLGEGKLRRAELLDRLGVRDFARVAQLSAEEAFRLLQEKHGSDTQQVWARFETELAKRTADAELRHQSELQALSVRNDTLSRRVEDSLRELAQLRGQNQELEAQMARVSRIGRREEMDFADEARTWPGVCLEGISRNGDFILNYRDPSGAVIPPRILIDNKNKTVVAESDISKLVRDAKERNSPVAVLVAKDESQLRQLDRECRWGQKDGIWVLRTTRTWLPRDLDVLRPLLERMGNHGVDFLNRDVALADKVRRSLIDLDEVEKELKKATKAIMSASGLVINYRSRLQELCEVGLGRKMPTGCELSAARIAQ
jgi:hypothetical protein